MERRWFNAKRCQCFLHLPERRSLSVTVNCPDSRGILDPMPPVLNVTAKSIPAPTVATSGTKPTGFNVTLTGNEPLSVTASSSNGAIVPDTGITISSGCGTTTLSCSVTLSPVVHANGSATITVAATDQYGQNGNGNAQVSYTYTPPSSGRWWYGLADTYVSGIDGYRSSAPYLI